MITTTDGTADPLSMQFDRGTGITDRETYERDLAERQRRHLESVRQHFDQGWQPCLHDACTECVGTGVKRDGSTCIHGIACPCPKHSVRC